MSPSGRARSSLFAGKRSYADLTGDQRRILRTAAANVVATKLTGWDVARRRRPWPTLPQGPRDLRFATPAEARACDARSSPCIATSSATRAHARRSTPSRASSGTGRAPDELPSCKRAAGEPTSTATTKLDGVWKMDTDRSAAPPEYFPENWGHWVFVFDRGRYAITQENKPSCTWGYGKFTVHGSRTRWASRTAAESLRAERATSPARSWSSTSAPIGTRSKLDAGGGADLPEQLPRQAVAAAVRHADAAYFSKRCPPPADALPG